MPRSRIPSPARSHTPLKTLRQHRSRATRSVESRACSNDSVKLSALIQEHKMDSFILSPLRTRRSMLSDNTDIGEPMRRSWWKRLDEDENSRDVMDVIESKETDKDENLEEYFDAEVVSQQKENCMIDLPESSDGESISSIVIPQRKLFTQKDSRTQKVYDKIIENREKLGQLCTSSVSYDKTINVGKKDLFNRGTKNKNKPLFPQTSRNISVNKTIQNNTKDIVNQGQVRNLFGNHAGVIKRKNIYADFIVSESEDEIPDIQSKVFRFSNKNEHQKHKKFTSQGARVTSPTADGNDIELDDWKLLPSSTMVDNHFGNIEESSPVKRGRLRYSIENKTTPQETSKIMQSNKSEISQKSSKTSKFKIGEDFIISQETEHEYINKSKEKTNATPNKSNINSTKNNKPNNKSNDDIINDVSNSLGKEYGLSKMENSPNLQKEKSKITEIAADIESESDQQNTTVEQVQYKNNDDNHFTPSEEELEIEQEYSVTTNIQHKRHKKDLTEIASDQSYNELPNIENNSHSEHKVDTNFDGEEEINNISADITQEKEDKDEENTCDNEEIDHSIIETDENNEIHVEKDIEDNHVGEYQENLDEVDKNNHFNINEEMRNKSDEEIHIKKDDKVQKHNESGKPFNSISSKDKNTDLEILNHEGTKKGNQISNEENSNKEIENRNIDEDQNTSQPEHQVTQNQNRYALDKLETKNNSQSIKTIALPDNNISKLNTNDSFVRNRERMELKSLEDVLHYAPDDLKSFVPKVRNTSIRKTKSIGRNYDVQPSLALLRESTGLSDEGSKNSSVERSGWDSHRVTRKTLRQTFGKDFTPRKSLRTLVMEKSAKRQTYAHDFTVRVPQACSTKLPEAMDVELSARDDDDDYHNNEANQNDNKSIETEQEKSHNKVPQACSTKLPETMDVELSARDNDEVYQNNESNQNGNSNETEHEKSHNKVPQACSTKLPETMDVELSARDNDELYQNNEANRNDDISIETEQEKNGNDNRNMLENETNNKDNNSNQLGHDTDLNNEHSNKSEHEINDSNAIQRENEKNHEENDSSNEMINGPHPKTDHNHEDCSKSECEVDGDSNEIDHGRSDYSNEQEHVTNLNNDDSDESENELDHREEETDEREETDIDNEDPDTDEDSNKENMDSNNSPSVNISEQISTPKMFASQSSDVPDGDVTDEMRLINGDHEVSRMKRQAKLEMCLLKIKEANDEIRRKTEENMKMRNSLKASSREPYNLFKVPTRLNTALGRVNSKTEQAKPKTKQIKSSFFPVECLPPELLEDMKYKPPKRFRPRNASWITKRLYKFLEDKLQPEYDYKARVKAEKLVEAIYNFTKDIRRHSVAPQYAIDVLKQEMARLNVVKTHHEFYLFFHDFMPREIRIKVVPDIVNNISLPRRGVFSDIIN